MKFFIATVMIVLCAISNVMSRNITIDGTAGNVHHITIEDEVKCEFGLLNNYNAYVRVNPNNNIEAYNDYNSNWESVAKNRNSNWLQYFRYNERKYAIIKRNIIGELEVDFDYYISRYNRPIYNVRFKVHDIIEIGNVSVVYNKNGKANISIILNHSGSNDLSYRLSGGDYQNSNIFSNLSSGIYTIEVKDNLTGYTHQKTISIENMEPLELIADIDSTDCSGTNGAIDISIKGGSRYLIFDGNDKVLLTKQLFVGRREFTIEGKFRVHSGDYNYLLNQSYTSLWGQDNCIEFGFRRGKPAFYIYTNNGARSGEASSVIPNDNNWHHIALRSNGNKIELILDGNIIKTNNSSYNTLESDDRTSGKPISFGDKVWGQGNESFIGDIASVSFWNKYLNTTTINTYNSSDPEGNEAGLLAAYNMNIRDEQKLKSVKGEYGILEGCRWSDNCSYSWINSKGKIITTNEDISGVGVDNFEITVNYSSGVSQVLSKTYSVGLKNDLNVNISISVARICEGEELSIISTVNGGVGNKTYKWESFSGSSWKTLAGSTNSNYKKKQSAGHKVYRLLLNSGICNKSSNSIEIDVYKKIRTLRIKHKRN